MRQKTAGLEGPRDQDHRRRGDVGLRQRRRRRRRRDRDAARRSPSCRRWATPRLGIRIGFNCGPVVERDGDVFGDAVNLAARLAAVATKGQIITARDTVMLMSPMLKANTRAITTIQVKGKAQEIQVYELMWQQSEDMTTLASHKSVFKPRNTTLRLKIAGHRAGAVRRATRRSPWDATSRRTWWSRSAWPRAPTARSSAASTSSSSPTTAPTAPSCTIEGDKEIVLRREEFTLRGHGWIAFGQSRTGATDVVEFFCE